MSEITLENLSLESGNLVNNETVAVIAPTDYLLNLGVLSNRLATSKIFYSLAMNPALLLVCIVLLLILLNTINHKQ